MTDIPFRDRAAHNEVAAHRDRVLSFAQWCDLNGFSKATGRRIIKRAEGPPVLQLSPRRIGIRESDNVAWQASRTRGAAA
jgi:predicted DNA-binding transcriptional regulator AlpA